MQKFEKGDLLEIVQPVKFTECKDMLGECRLRAIVINARRAVLNNDDMYYECIADTLERFTFFSSDKINANKIGEIDLLALFNV